MSESTPLDEDGRSDGRRRWWQHGRTISAFGFSEPRLFGVGVERGAHMFRGHVTAALDYLTGVGEGASMILALCVRAAF